MKLTDSVIDALEGKAFTVRAVRKRKEKEDAKRAQFAPFHKKLRKLNKKK